MARERAGKGPLPASAAGRRDEQAPRQDRARVACPSLAADGMVVRAAGPRPPRRGDGLSARLCGAARLLELHAPPSAASALHRAREHHHGGLGPALLAFGADHDPVFVRDGRGRVSAGPCDRGGDPLGSPLPCGLSRDADGADGDVAGVGGARLAHAAAAQPRHRQPRDPGARAAVASTGWARPSWPSGPSCSSTSGSRCRS